MQKYVNDTIKYCNHYIISWFVSLVISIISVITIVFSFLLNESVTDPNATTVSFVPQIIIMAIIILVSLALIIWSLTSYILLIVNLTKLEPILGRNYTVYLVLCIVGFFFIIVDLVACFLIKRDLNEYKYRVPSKDQEDGVIRPETEPIPRLELNQSNAGHDNQPLP